MIKAVNKKIVSLQPLAWTAITTLIMRPLVCSNMSDKMMHTFLVDIFSVPTLVHQLNYMVRKDL